MSDPKPTAPVGSASAVPPPAPPADPAPKKADPAPIPSPDPEPKKDERPSGLEIHAGGYASVGDSFQLDAGPSYLFPFGLILGGELKTNFGSKVSGGARVGWRFHLTDTIGLQPTLSGGVGKHSDYAFQTGDLKENVLLNGIYGYINPFLLLTIQPPNAHGFGAAVGVGANIEFRGGEAVPMALLDGSDPRSTTVTPTFNIVGTWDWPAKKSYTKSNYPPPPPPPYTEVPPDAPPPAPKKEENIEKRIDTNKQKVLDAQKEDAAKKKIADTIDTVRKDIKRLKDNVTDLNKGINRSNEIGKTFEATLDELSKVKGPLSDEKRKALEAKLDALLKALEMNGSNMADNSAESQEIRKGLRFIFVGSSTGKPYGNRIERQTGELKKELKSHKETALSEKAEKAEKLFKTFFKEFPNPIKIEDLKKDSDEIEGAMKTLEAVEKDYNLGTNPDWVELKKDLQTTQGEVMRMNRELNAVRELGALLTGPTYLFADQVKTPDKAKDAFGAALKLIKEKIGKEKYEGVTLDALRKQYGDYFAFLSYNLNRFMEIHTPPVIVNRKEREKWFESVKLAQELLCHVEPGAKRCTEKLEEPPKPEVKTPTPPDPNKDKDKDKTKDKDKDKPVVPPPPDPAKDKDKDKDKGKGPKIPAPPVDPAAPK